MTTISRDRMLRISGSVDSDASAASQFAQEVLKASEDRARAIKAVSELEEILSHDVMQNVKSHLAGLRHLNAVVTEVSDFHRLGPLGGALTNVQRRIAELLNESEVRHKVLAAFYPQ